MSVTTTISDGQETNEKDCLVAFERGSVAGCLFCTTLEYTSNPYELWTRTARFWEMGWDSTMWTYCNLLRDGELSRK